MIVIQGSIMVKGQTASLNTPIYLYRGDGDITLLLNLKSATKNAKFGKISIDNIVTEEHMYGTACIYKPDGTLSFVAKAEVVNKQIQVIISRDIMDESVEVGEHKLQIHLFDKDNNRLTIPEVGQIIISEPLCGNNNNNNIPITQAQVDNSMVGYSVVANEVDKLVNGYSTYNWNTGEYITANKLNNMIMGIDEAIAGVGVDLSNYVTKDELNTKADIDDIPTNISQLTNDSKYITETYAENMINTQLDELMIILNELISRIEELENGQTVQPEEPDEEQIVFSYDGNEGLTISGTDIIYDAENEELIILNLTLEGTKWQM